MATTQELITALTGSRNTIRTKLVDFGLVTGTAKLGDCATAVDGIANNGAVDISVQEGESYTIPKGYHNGAGVVKGVAGGGNYTLQPKTVTPTKSQQSITPDQGYYGLSGVTVKAIPENFQDVSATTAAAPDVLATKVFIAADGTTTTGTMPNNGAVSKTLDATTSNQSYSIPAGYHNGNGKVTIVLEEKTATPTTTLQNITPTAGKVLSKVTVNAIPKQYGDATGKTATAAGLLEGETAIGWNSAEEKAVPITGTMPNNGVVGTTLDATKDKQSYNVPAGYTTGGTVSIVLEEKSATPTKSVQTITPTTGKVLSKVTVNAIPAIYGDATEADAVAANILSGKKAIVKANNAATMVEGTMTDNGTLTGLIDGLTTTSYTIPSGYTAGGTVSLTNDINEALAAI